jgi:hypothetical protein
MLLAPKPGFQYRDTVTLQLVPPEGMELDETNLDVARAIACGDLVEPPPPAKAAKADSAPKE